VKRCGDAPESSGRRGIKWKGVEVGLCLLQTKLPRRLLAWIGRHEGTDGELCQSDGCDEWSWWERSGIVDPLEQNHRAGVEDAAI
jgi:hypothetical protein